MNFQVASVKIPLQGFTTFLACYQLSMIQSRMLQLLPCTWKGAVRRVSGRGHIHRASTSGMGIQYKLSSERELWGRVGALKSRNGAVYNVVTSVGNTQGHWCNLK